MIRLRDFFQTGQIADLHLGASRLAVRSYFGAPDDFLNPKLAYDDDGWSETDAPIWWYGGIEFAFDREATPTPELQPLRYIQFQPYYLYLRPWPTRVQRWVFRSRRGPTHDRLVAAFDRCSFVYQDTGLETLQFNPAGEGFTLNEYQPSAAADSNAESFGTIVLKNGIQIRYAEDNSLIQIQIGSTWLFQGKERFVQWT